MQEQTFGEISEKTVTCANIRSTQSVSSIFYKFGFSTKG